MSFHFSITPKYKYFPPFSFILCIHPTFQVFKEAGLILLGNFGTCTRVSGIKGLTIEVIYKFANVLLIKYDSEVWMCPWQISSFHDIHVDFLEQDLSEFCYKFWIHVLPLSSLCYYHAPTLSKEGITDPIWLLTSSACISNFGDRLDLAAVCFIWNCM